MAVGPIELVRPSKSPTKFDLPHFSPSCSLDSRARAGVTLRTNDLMAAFEHPLARCQETPS